MEEKDNILMNELGLESDLKIEKAQMPHYLIYPVLQLPIIAQYIWVQS